MELIIKTNKCRTSDDSDSGISRSWSARKGKNNEWTGGDYLQRTEDYKNNHFSAVKMRE